MYCSLLKGELEKIEKDKFMIGMRDFNHKVGNLTQQEESSNR